MTYKLVDIVAKSIKEEFYKGGPTFGPPEAVASIRAVIDWLKLYEEQNELSFMFPAIDVLEEQLKD